MAIESKVAIIGVQQLKELAVDSWQRIASNQLPNGLIPASVGRYDDRHFDGMVWIKDDVRAVKFAIDPNFQQAFPELLPNAKKLYLSSIQAMLQLQGQPEQFRRFQNRPGIPNKDGYSTIDDPLAPAIKFTKEGYIYQDWGHNQPDNWGTLLLEAGKGIEVGWPVLAKHENQLIAPGAILQEITAYTVGLKTERLICRSIWEHNNAWSSYSTRRIVLAGLEQVERVWPELTADAKARGYQLKVGQEQIKDAVGGLREKAKEHFPADYTDVYGHESAADLASMVVLNDVDLPTDERIIIMGKIPELETRQGFYRYYGDPWKRGRAEAKWIMGKPIVARYYFTQSRELYAAGKRLEAFRALDHGLDRISDILEIRETYGYIPELFEDRGKCGMHFPNNNELVWTLGYTIEAATAGIMASQEAEHF